MTSSDCESAATAIAVHVRGDARRFGPVLAALTPESDEVIYTDDVVKPFDIERDVKDVDLVGISVDSKTASRSYAIAQAYRQRGVKVVLGGIHPTALPEEALRFADAVVVSEAEDLWPQLVEDVRLAVEGQVPVFFHGRTGGMLPTPGEVVREVARSWAMTSLVARPDVDRRAG